MTPAAVARSVRVERAGCEVSALLLRPAGARACFAFAHGAGVGIRHPFMEALSQGLAAHRTPQAASLLVEALEDDRNVRDAAEASLIRLSRGWRSWKNWSACRT